MNQKDDCLKYFYGFFLSIQYYHKFAKISDLSDLYVIKPIFSTDVNQLRVILLFDIFFFFFFVKFFHRA